MTTYRLQKRGWNQPLNSMCDQVSEAEKKSLRPLIVEMLRIALHDNLPSLSANQLGQTYRIFVTNVPNDHIRVFINPEIVVLDYDQVEVEETCASHPRKNAQRWRHRAVRVWATNLKDYQFILDTDDPMFTEQVSHDLAVRIQHEMEHLNGTNVRVEPLEQTEPDDYLSVWLSRSLGPPEKAEPEAETDHDTYTET